MKVGVMFGNPETTPGGNALKFYSSVRLEVRRSAQIKSNDGKEVIGNEVRVKVVKNKLAPPFKQADLELHYGSGICQATEVINWGVKLGILEKKGAWFAYQGRNIGQGKEKVRMYFNTHPDEYNEILNAVTDAYLSTGTPKDTEPGKSEGDETSPEQVAAEYT